MGEASETLKAAAFLWLGTYLQHTGRTSVRGRALPFCGRTLRKDLLPGLRSCSQCSLNRPDKSRRFAPSEKKPRGRAWRARAAPAQQVALSLQMWMLLMSTRRLLFEIQWGAKITVSLLRNVRRMFIISKRVFVQRANDGNGNWRAYADKHSKKAFFFLSLSNGE